MTNVWMPTKETKHKGLCFLLLKNSHYCLFPLAVSVANPTEFSFSGYAVPLYKKIFVFIYFLSCNCNECLSSSLNFHFLVFFFKRKKQNTSGGDFFGTVILQKHLKTVSKALTWKAQRSIVRVFWLLVAVCLLNLFMI